MNYTKTKKQRKRQKIKMKEQEKYKSDEKVGDKGQKMVNITPHLIPIIKFEDKQEDYLIIKNKSLSDYDQLTLQMIKKCKKITILGKENNIPKTITAAERLKRILTQKIDQVLTKIKSHALKQDQFSHLDICIFTKLMTPVIYNLMFEIQKLSRENRELKDKLRSLASQLQCSKNDYEMQKILVKKCHEENNRLVIQIKQLRRRQEQKNNQKQEMQSRYLNVLRKLQDEVEERKRKYHKLQAKIQPLMDHDSVRLKILNQVEGMHSMEVDELKRKNNALKDKILKLKRQNYLLQHKLDENKIQCENQIRKMKNQANKKQENSHFNKLTYDICNEVENRLLVNYQQARKQSEYYKDKYFTTEKKYLEKIENLEQQITFAKERCRSYEHQLQEVK